MNDRKLGRGFDDISGQGDAAAIFDLTGEVAYAESDVLQVEVGRIDPNPHQPRQKMKAEALDELVESIRKDGVLQPILVRVRGDRFELIAGERRWLAAKKAGLGTVQAVIRNVDDAKALELAIIENIQREDLNPIERAAAYKDLIERFGITQEEAARRLSVNRSTVSNLLRLLELPEEVREHLASERLSMGHARALLGVNPPERLISLARRVVAEGASVRETEVWASETRPPAPTRSRGPRHRREKANYIKAFESNLKQALSTRVSIVEWGKPGTGRLTIDFYSLDQFETIYYRLLTPAENPLEPGRRDQTPGDQELGKQEAEPGNAV